MTGPKIADNAATDVFVVTASNVSVTGVPGVPVGSLSDIISITFTPVATGSALITASAATEHTTDAVQINAGLNTYFKVNGTLTSNTTQSVFSQDMPSNTTLRASFTRSFYLNVVSGTPYTVILQGNKAGSVIIKEVEMRVEVVKK